MNHIFTFLIILSLSLVPTIIASETPGLIGNSDIKKCFDGLKVLNIRRYHRSITPNDVWHSYRQISRHVYRPNNNVIISGDLEFLVDLKRSRDIVLSCIREGIYQLPMQLVSSSNDVPSASTSTIFSTPTSVPTSPQEHHRSDDEEEGPRKKRFRNAFIYYNRNTGMEPEYNRENWINRKYNEDTNHLTQVESTQELDEPNSIDSKFNRSIGLLRRVMHPNIDSNRAPPLDSENETIDDDSSDDDSINSFNDQYNNYDDESVVRSLDSDDEVYEYDNSELDVVRIHTGNFHRRRPLFNSPPMRPNSELHSDIESLTFSDLQNDIFDDSE